MTRVLVSAASRHGATAELGEAIAAGLRQSGVHADFLAPEEVRVLREYDAFVIGSAIYAGHWLSTATELCRRVGRERGERQVWLFSCGPVGPSTGKLARQMWTDPAEIESAARDTDAAEHKIFAGKLVRARLGRFERMGLFFFRQFEGDFRDWPAVADWSRHIAAALAGARTDTKQEVRG